MKVTLCIGFMMVAFYSGSVYTLTTDNDKDIAGTPNNIMPLEEVIVTAKKRETRLQDTPIAISVLTDLQLVQQGVSSLGDLIGGTISSLNINHFSNASSTLSVAIRGNGAGDVAQTSRDPNVAIYLDEIYLGRAQGLNVELPELSRIEVLRGPQGTLFGRNATAGAIHLISKRPTGKFGIRQSIGVGSDDLRSATTHIDLPKWAGIASKIDFMYKKRDGWVENLAPDELGHNALDKTGYRISIDFSPMDDLTVSYAYNDSDVESTHLYYQFYRDFLGVFGDEGNRQDKTRLPITPLDPTRVTQELHSLSFKWLLSDSLTFESHSSYRELDDRTRNNFGGSLYFNGIIDAVDVEQEQFTQEFRLVGSHQRLEWVAGIYHYEEAIDEAVQQFFSLDIFGTITGVPLSPITPPTNFDAVVTGAPVELRIVNTELESTAIYAQATWTPPILDDRFDVTVGVRHTRENKSGALTTGGFIPFVVPSDDDTYPAVILNYRWSENSSFYGSWSSAYRSGGVNSRSNDLLPFDKEEVISRELGMKMDGWEGRLRLNIAAFQTEYKGMFIDVFDPDNLIISNTINAANDVEVNGVEIDFSAVLLQGLTVGLSYTNLDGDMPDQPNPLANNALESFLMTQTPQHAGSITIDYVLPRFNFGTLSAHFNAVSSSDYNHWPSGGVAHPDGYTLMNARIMLADIPITQSNNRSNLSVSLWGKNIADEEYVISSFHFEGVATVHAFGEPRSLGVDLKYTY